MYKGKLMVATYIEQKQMQVYPNSTSKECFIYSTKVNKKAIQRHHNGKAETRQTN
jgi:hypothetical protein